MTARLDLTALLGMKPLLWIAVAVALFAIAWMLWQTGGWS